MARLLMEDAEWAFFEPFLLAIRGRGGRPASDGNPPYLVGRFGRIYAACLSFCAGVIPPIPMLGRSLLYVHSHRVARS